MAVLARLDQFLVKNNVSYTHHVHAAVYTAREVASVERIPVRRVAKTVVYFEEEHYGMAVLPADYVVEMQALRTALGRPRVRLATEEELAALFPDCELGAMPPFGNLYGLPTCMESALAEAETMLFNAGTHRDVVYLGMEDYKRLVKPAILHFARLVAA